METGNNQRRGHKIQSIDQSKVHQATFVRLYRRYYDDVFRYCVHRLLDRHVAEDLTAEVFLKIAKHSGRFNGDEQQLRCWIYRITTNTINSYLRKTKRRRGLLLRLVERNRYRLTDQPESSNENLAPLKAALLSLKPRYQRIITLRFFENLKSEQIGQILGCTPGTARSQLARAVAQLRKKLIAAGVLNPGDNRYE